MNTTDENNAGRESSVDVNENVNEDTAANETGQDREQDSGQVQEDNKPELVPTFTKKYIDPVANTVLTVLTVFGVVAIGLWVYRAITGVMLVVFVSGSMEPTIPTGSLTHSSPIEHQDVSVGDVLTVTRPGEPMPISHRVISVNDEDNIADAIDQEYEYHLGGDEDWLRRLSAGLFGQSSEPTAYPLTEEAVDNGEVSVVVMSGDANETDDPRYYMVTDDNAVEYNFHLAYGGYVLAWLESNIVVVFGLLIAVLAYFMAPFRSYKPKA